jgi:hypothetical protein
MAHRLIGIVPGVLVFAVIHAVMPFVFLQRLLVGHVFIRVDRRGLSYCYRGKTPGF